MRKMLLIVLAFSSTVLTITVPCMPKGSKPAACSDGGFADAAQQLQKTFQRIEAQLSVIADGQLEADAK